MDDAKCTLDDAHGFHCSNMQLEQCQMVVYKFIAAVQYMHVLRQLRRGFCTIVLHLPVQQHSHFPVDAGVSSV